MLPSEPFFLGSNKKQLPSLLFLPFPSLPFSFPFLSFSFPSLPFPSSSCFFTSILQIFNITNKHTHKHTHTHTHSVPLLEALLNHAEDQPVEMPRRGL